LNEVYSSGKRLRAKAKVVTVLGSNPASSDTWWNLRSGRRSSVEYRTKSKKVPLVCGNLWIA
jgi:hypothetical protein